MLHKLIRNKIFWLITGFILVGIAIIFLSEKIDKTILIIDHVTVEKERDIKPIQDSLVVPVLYNHIEILNQLSVEKRKKRFIDVVLPAVLIYRHQLAQRREKVRILLEKSRYQVSWDVNDSLFMAKMYSDYKTKNFKELMRRMNPPPISLTLAQAALESGWGSSRFFKEANNIFGIWSFDRGEPRIIAGEYRDGKPVHLKKYDDLLGSIADYHKLLASSSAYDDFRDCINRDNNVFELIWYLRKYSERRDQYVIMLRNVIVANNLTRYDWFLLDPEYYDYPKDETSIF